MEAGGWAGQGKTPLNARNVYMLYNTRNYLGSTLTNTNCGIFNLVKTFLYCVLYFKTKTHICLFALDLFWSFFTLPKMPKVLMLSTEGLHISSNKKILHSEDTHSFNMFG